MLQKVGKGVRFAWPVCLIIFRILVKTKPMEGDKSGITEEVGVVTNATAANMIKMMEYLAIHFLSTGCINYFIQLTINDEILKDQESDQDM